MQTGAEILPDFPADVEATAPALFTANGDGRGVVEATAIRSLAGSMLLTPIPVFQCGDAPGSCTGVPIELGVDTPVYVTLFCTGIRGSPVGGVAVLMAGRSVPVLSVGPQPGVDGMDQVAVALPLDLRGSGEIDVVLQVNGALSNTARINVL